MKKIDMAAIVTIAMFACLLFCTPALADYNFDGFPVVTRDSGTVNGGVFIDYVPWAATTTLTGNFNVPNGNIAWARLYTGIWGGRPEYEGLVNVTFNDDYNSNGLGPIHLQGQNDTNPNVWCSGSGKHWLYYDVTDLVNAGVVNTATTTKINETAGDFDGRVYGIVLVVVYEGGANPKNIQYWINDGSDGLNYVTSHNEGTTDFAGPVSGSVANAELTMVHLTAYDPGCADCLQFNGAALDTSMVDSDTFELNSWDVTSHVETSGNDAWYSRGGDGYVNVCNAILTLVSEPEELPDLVISDKWLCWPDNCMICYNVTNIGDGTAPVGHNTALYVDDEEVAQDHVPVDLAPGESYTGCFNGYEWGYTPPSDEIKVCADNNETLDELEEDNNCLTNIWMCGDVNGDHTVNVIDVVLIYKRALDPGYPLDLPWAGDVNCDRNINVIDVVMVYKRALDPGYDLDCCCEVV